MRRVCVGVALVLLSVAKSASIGEPLVDTQENSAPPRKSQGSSKRDWLPKPVAKVLDVDDGKSTFKISHRAGQTWKIGDRACLTRKKWEVSCGEVVMTTATEATVRLTETTHLRRSKRTPRNLTQKEPAPSIKPERGDVVWRQSDYDLYREATQSPADMRVVAHVVPNSKNIIISQNNTESLQINDTLCIYRDGVEKACGKVAKTSPTKALVKLAVVPQNIQQGDLAFLVGRANETNSALPAPSTPITVTANTTPAAVPIRAPASTVPSIEKDASPEVPVTRRISFAPMLGFRYLSYSESGVAPFYGSYADVGFSVAYPLSPSFELTASALASLVTLRGNAAVNPRYIDLNAMGRYTLDLAPNWRLFLNGGWGFSAFLTDESAFGFTHGNSPFVYPEIGWRLNDQHSLGLSGRLSPLIGYAFPSSRVIDVSLGWSTTLSNGHWLGIHLGYSKLQFDVDISGVSFDLSSESLLFKYRF